MSKRRSLQNTLNEIAFDPLLCNLTANISFENLAQLSGYLAVADPYGEADFVRRALYKINGTNKIGARKFFEHQLWCAWREARWQSGSTAGVQVNLDVVNPEWLNETVEAPTIIVAPMTMTISDAVMCIKELFKDRPFIIYGESIKVMGSGNFLAQNNVAGEGLKAVRAIRSTLKKNGVLCTYPDFVYHGHVTCSVSLFGVRRPISSGFLSLAALPGVMLLPCILLREEDGIVAYFEEPVRVELDGYGRSVQRAAAPQIAQAIASKLENLIRRAPEQWLLLPTLTFDAPQMAKIVPIIKQNPST